MPMATTLSLGLGKDKAWPAISTLPNRKIYNFKNYLGEVRYK